MRTPDADRLLHEIHDLWQQLAQLGGRDSRRGTIHQQQYEQLSRQIADRSARFRSITQGHGEIRLQQAS